MRNPRKNGIECWIAPRNIVPGTDWATSITKAISDSAIFLLIYSENSAESNQVPRELMLAGSKGTCILPYKIDNTEMKEKYEYYLGECHWITANPSKKDYKEAELIAAAKNAMTSSAEKSQSSAEIHNNIVINNTPESRPTSSKHNLLWLYFFCLLYVCLLQSIAKPYSINIVAFLGGINAQIKLTPVPLFLQTNPPTIFIRLPLQRI